MYKKIIASFFMILLVSGVAYSLLTILMRIRQQVHRKRKCHDGCVHSDKLQKSEIGISLVDFYDFIATNLTVYPANAPIRSISKQIAMVIHSFRLFKVKNQVIREIKKYGTPQKVEDVLQNKALANIVAVSVLIVDKEGKIKIVKRTKNVAISSGMYGMACAGTVDGEDLKKIIRFFHVPFEN